MKSLVTFVIGAALAVAGVYLFHRYGQPTKTPYVLDLEILNGQRVLLKDGSPKGIQTFEEYLNQIDPNGVNGTSVDIKPSADSKAEVEGPLAGGEFRTPNVLIGPERSVHNTQRIATSKMDDVQGVLAYFSTGAGDAPTPSPTPSPTATP